MLNDSLYKSNHTYLFLLANNNQIISKEHVVATDIQIIDELNYNVNSVFFCSNWYDNGGVSKKWSWIGNKYSTDKLNIEDKQ